MSSGVKKLVIHAYDNPDFSSGEIGEFTVMFNPETYNDKLEIEYEEEQGQGTSGSPQVFKGIKPKELNLEFTIDGTQVSGPIKLSNDASESVAEGDDSKIDVQKKITEFKSICADYQGELHRTHFLHIIWGNLSFYGVLKTADIKYTLFDKEGKPLRAKISCTFAQTISNATREREEGNRSPDLTHIRIVKKGDTLPLMAYKIYGDSNYYAEVAAANNLKDFRNLKPGSQIYFPPIDKKAAR